MNALGSVADRVGRSFFRVGSERWLMVLQRENRMLTHGG